MTTFAKDPWLAVNLSMFFPGIGQFYAEKPIRGIIFLVGQIILIAITIASIFSPSGNTVIGLVCLGISLIVYLFNIVDAHLCIYQQQGDQYLEKIPRKYKNPWFAVCISRVLPGLGQLYSNKAVSGLLFLSSSLILLKLDDFFTFLLIVPPTISAIATYHAYITFPQRQKQSHRFLITIMAGFIFMVGLIGSYVPNWIHQKIFTIPSESMQPTLQVGDQIFVSESHTFVPQTGDIIVFKSFQMLNANVEKQSEVYIIKRVIATPGQIVRIDNGIVYINDQPLAENYIAEPPTYQLGPQLVPDHTYFVLGDNRNNSFDSHEWGFLPKKYVFGRADKIFWPPARIRSLIREN